jgi:hypothetical protein
MATLVDDDDQFILLELYGLCSGDKRSYEFVEAFHGNLIQVSPPDHTVQTIILLTACQSVQEYSQVCNVSGSGVEDESEQFRSVHWLIHAEAPGNCSLTSTTIHRLLEALYILDCYRVIVMHRPPSLSWHHVVSFSQMHSAGSQIDRLFHSVAELTDGGHACTSLLSNEFSLASLACLCIYSWPARYPRQNSYGPDNMLRESLCLWKADVAELACDAWLRTTGKAKDPSHLAIYHMMNIMLHTNLTVLQSFAHSAPGSTERDPKKGLAAREIHMWTQDRHYKIARWHAESMITSIEEAFTAPTNRVERQHPQQPSSWSKFSTTETRRLPYEAPHVPYAIYYATLVLWCGLLADTTTVSSSVVAQAPIARGERILSLHKLHIAQLLARVLNEIK